MLIYELNKYNINAINVYNAYDVITPVLNPEMILLA